MKKLIISCVIFTILSSLLLSGCGNGDRSADVTDQKTTNVTLIEALQSNQPAPSLNLIDDLLVDVSRTFGSVNLIRLDGKPTLLDTLTIPRKKGGLYTKTQLDDIATSQASKIEAAAAQVVAEAPESDLLSALRLAGQCVQPVEGEENNLIIFSNGISTVAPLDMSVSLLQNMDIDATVQTLEKTNNIPDLSTYDKVEFYQLGETLDPQHALSENKKKILKELWENVFCAAGLTSDQIMFNDTPSINDGENATNLPPIKVITTVETDNAIQSQSQDVNLSFSEKTISFTPNTAKFSDIDSAKEALQPLVDILSENPVDIVAVGQTATVGEAESSLTLSKSRAEAVASLLKSMGVQQIVAAIGCGYSSSNPLHVKDIDENGNLLEEKAARNRIVSILDASTPLAQNIIQNFRN